MKPCNVDYLDLEHRETRQNQELGYQLELYKDNGRNSYAVLLRRQRFGTVEACTAGLAEQDAQQILETVNTPEVDIRKVLERDK